MTSVFDEICAEEDKKVFEALTYVAWMTSAQRCKGNILKYKRTLKEKRKMFRWFVDWAATIRKSDYAKFR